VAQETTSAPRLAVLPFGWGGCPFFACPERAAFITNMVEEALFRTGRYHLLDRRALLAILQEQGLSGSQLASPQAATTVGKLTGAQALILGNLGRLSSEFLGYAAPAREGLRGGAVRGWSRGYPGGRRLMRNSTPLDRSSVTAVQWS
jgi:hypothetical protein